MDKIDFIISRLASGFILHWLKGARVQSRISLGAAIRRSHGPFRVGDVILVSPKKFSGKFPHNLSLAECDPVFVVEVRNKGRMSTTLKNIGIDNKSCCLTNTFYGRNPLPHRLIEKSGEIWLADFSDATFVSFEAKSTNAYPKKIGALLEFADGSKRRSRNRLSPKTLNFFASSWNKKLEVIA
jgi:hypothetical protein